MADVQTHIEPPSTEPDEGGGGPSTRISVWISTADDTALDAAVQLFDEAASNPDQIADALLAAALAAANLAGPDVAWAAMQRFARYQGGAPDA